MGKHRVMEVWFAGIFDSWGYFGEKVRKWAGNEGIAGLRKNSLSEIKINRTRIRAD